VLRNRKLDKGALCAQKEGDEQDQVEAIPKQVA